MLYLPPISDYKPFYIQFSGGSAVDIRNTYKVIVKSPDYPSARKAKEPYKNQWFDQNGDEEYIPSTGLFTEAFTMKLECVMFARNSSLDAAIADLKAGVVAFQNALFGGAFSTLDAWTGFGFKEARVQEFPMPNSDAYQAWGNGVRVIFTVILKVNTPTERMKLSNGALVEE